MATIAQRIDTVDQKINDLGANVGANDQLLYDLLQAEKAARIASDTALQEALGTVSSNPNAAATPFKLEAQEIADQLAATGVLLDPDNKTAFTPTEIFTAAHQVVKGAGMPILPGNFSLELLDGALPIEGQISPEIDAADQMVVAVLSDGTVQVTYFGSNEPTLGVFTESLANPVQKMKDQLSPDFLALRFPPAP
jgi:hypothetical protein